MKANHKWLVVVNLSGIHGPIKLIKMSDGRWWDRSGNWDYKPGQEKSFGYEAAAFDSERDAKLFWRGARMVADSLIERLQK